MAADDANLNRLQQRALVIGGIGLAAGLVGALVDRSAGDAIFGLSPQTASAHLRWTRDAVLRPSW